MDYLTRREWFDDPRGSDDRSLALLARIGDESVIIPEPEVKIATEVKVHSELEVTPEAKIEPVPESVAKSEIRKVVSTKTEEPKKKAIPSWTLVIVIGLAIGLLVETTCIVKQHQTIFRQQQEILCLNQRLTQKKAQTENVQLKTFPPPTTKPVPATEKKGVYGDLPATTTGHCIARGKSNVGHSQSRTKDQCKPHRKSGKRKHAKGGVSQ